MEVVLHIGTEKTGTTSIQTALWQDRKRLAAHGILVPKLLGTPNHMELTVATIIRDQWSEIQLSEFARTGLNREAYEKACAAALRKEVARGNFDRIMFSNEHCHSRVRLNSDIARILSMIGATPDKVRIIVYLRRQDRLAASVYSTRLKLGGRGELFNLNSPLISETYYDYDKLLDLYEGVVGRSNMTVRLYERSQLAGGDVVRDFYKTANLPIDPPEVSPQNTSLSRSQMLFLKAFNETFPLMRDGRLNPERGPIMRAIDGTLPGPPYLPSRSDAEAFYARFRSGNANVKARYFPDAPGDKLFDEDMSLYSEQVDETLSFAETMDFVNAIWRFSRRQQGGTDKGIGESEDRRNSLLAPIYNSRLVSQLRTRK